MWPLRGAFKLPLYGRGGRALMAARPAESRVRIDYPLGHTHKSTTIINNNTNHQNPFCLGMCVCVPLRSVKLFYFIFIFIFIYFFIYISFFYVKNNSTHPHTHAWCPQTQGQSKQCMIACIQCRAHTFTGGFGSGLLLLD